MVQLYQELIVLSITFNIELIVHKVDCMNTQVDKIKEEFAKRLKQAMDSKNYPLRGRARILSKEFDISDKAASKWLNGEAIPETSKIPILARFLDTTSEWLLSGEMPAKDETTYLNERVEDDLNKVCEKFINDFNSALKNKKLTLEIVKTLNQNLNLMTK